ncbi:MAG TPA: DUF6064 family protein [Thermoanaerobaculia bacterium]|nr:DUF6064 family protein [Thermoanaerobaculia bacterium]
MSLINLSAQPIRVLAQFAAPIAAVPTGVVYSAGLLAVALLAFRSMAGRAIPVILSLLWLWAATAFLPSPIGEGQTLLAAALFLLQVLVLLARGLVGGRRRITMPSPVGLSRLAGGLLIGYSLALDPLLRTWAPFKDVGAPGPFSLVPFTLGLLLFLRPLPWYLMALPLAWAFLGGAGALDPRVGFDPGLAASVLAGVLFLLPHRQNVVTAEGDTRLETWPAYAARTRRAFGQGLFLLFLAATPLTWFALKGTEGGALLTRWPAVHTGLFAILALGYWLWLPAWLGPGFRRLAWGAVAQLRRARASLHWWLDLWPAWLLASSAVLVAIPRIHKLAPTLDLKEWKIPLSIVGGAITLLIFLYVVRRARQRLVILDFDNYTGDEKLNVSGRGLASRLRNELAGISALYQLIDEALPLPSGRVIPVTIGVEDSLGTFHDVAGPDATFHIWKLEIPVGLLLRLLGRLVGGPRLTGSLHRQGDELFLLADYTGGGRIASWRIPAHELPAEKNERGGSELAYRLIENLAYRVVTAIGNIGSQRWESVHWFTLGLRAYRDTLLATQDLAAELRQAENCFIQALAHDRTFAQCHYNLGVVYRGLKCFDSAEAAFREILEADPEWTEAHYALANVYLDKKLYRRAALYSRKAIEVRPFDARPWNLSGIARFWDLDTRASGVPSAPQDTPIDRPHAEIIKDFEIATALSWRSLICLALGKQVGNPLRVERYFASRCAGNLSLVQVRYRESLSEAPDTAREALSLSPRSALFQLIHGEALSEAQRLSESRVPLYDAFGDALSDDDRVQRWMYLLDAQPAPVNGENGDIRTIYQALLDGVVPSEDTVLGAAGRGPMSRYQEYKKFLESTLKELQNFKTKNQTSWPYFVGWQRAVTLLRELEFGSKVDEAYVKILPKDERVWADAQVKLWQARIRLVENPKKAETLITHAIDVLKEDHHRQVRRQGLYTLRARASLLKAGSAAGSPRRELLVCALADAELSVSQEPESPARRWVLAEVHGACGDVERATAERWTALHLRRGTDFLESADTIGRIAEEHLSCARIEASRDGALQRGFEILQKILGLLESKLLDPGEPERRFDAHAAAHYWIGCFHLERGDWKSAAHCLKIACEMGFLPVDVRLRLGVACFGAGTFDDAEKAFWEAARLQPTDSTESAPSEPFAEVLLSWAMMYAERDSRLSLAYGLARQAERRWILPAAAPRRRELSALHHECLGRIFFRRGLFTESIDELEQAVRLQGTARCHNLLAEVLRAAGNHGAIESSSAYKRAQLAAERAERIRRNGGGNLFGVWRLLPNVVVLDGATSNQK